MKHDESVVSGTHHSLRLWIILLTCGSFIALILYSSPERVYACEVLYSPPAEKLERADAVFLGTVVDIQTFVVQGTPDQHAVFFKVDRYWKSPEGKDYENLVVLQPIGEGSCGFPFEENKMYLVYASDRPLYDNILFTGLGAAQPVEDAQEDLSVLGDWTVPARQLSWDEQLNRITFRPESTSQGEWLLPIIGVGAAIAGTVAFFSLRRLKENR